MGLSRHWENMDDQRLLNPDRTLVCYLSQGYRKIKLMAIVGSVRPSVRHFHSFAKHHSQNVSFSFFTFSVAILNGSQRVCIQCMSQLSAAERLPDADVTGIEN